METTAISGNLHWGRPDLSEWMKRDRCRGRSRPCRARTVEFLDACNAGPLRGGALRRRRAGHMEAMAATPRIPPTVLIILDKSRFSSRTALLRHLDCRARYSQAASEKQNRRQSDDCRRFELPRSRRRSVAGAWQAPLIAPGGALLETATDVSQPPKSHSAKCSTARLQPSAPLRSPQPGCRSQSLARRG